MPARWQRSAQCLVTTPARPKRSRIRTVAETNSGIVMAKIANVETAKSTGRSRHRPVTTPRKIAKGTPAPTNSGQQAANCPAGRRPVRQCSFRHWQRYPDHRARHLWPSQNTGLLRDGSGLAPRGNSPAVLPLASRSRNAVQLSPGSISTPAKMIIETIQTVTSPRNNRRSSIASMGQYPVCWRDEGRGNIRTPSSDSAMNCQVTQP